MWFQRMAQQRKIFDAMNRYVFNVFNNIIKEGKAMIILRQHNNVMDGREVWIGLIYFYERKENLDLVRDKW